MEEIDKRNFRWFQNDHTKANLISIKIAPGELRGLRGTNEQPFQVDFLYPITAIAGRNGTGKTTLLALASCAYHNNDSGFVPFGRKKTYYTFSDFFIQSSEEVPPEGISILYQYRYNRWRKTNEKPDGVGDGWLLQRKKQGGKWTDYSKRIPRNVVYMGIERVLPDAEKSTARNYSKIFSATSLFGWEDEVRQIVSRILNRDYDDFQYGYTNNQKYRLPIVRSKGLTYSGFNMGAGESALFDIFSTIFDCTQNIRENRGILILLDEIELGLHEEAQRRLIYELKRICAEKQIQVICTTHSAAIFDCLPPEACVFLERFGNYTKVLYGVSSTYATGKLSGRSLAELDIFVEDEVAQAILESTLSNDLRSRINILPIGSAGAIIQQMASRYRERKAKISLPACAILDGDQANLEGKHLNTLNKRLESPNDETKKTVNQWAQSHISYLPGSEWPEKWILTQDKYVFNLLSDEFGVSDQELNQFIDEALLAGKHNEFWTLSRKLNRELAYVRARFCKQAMEANPSERHRLQQFIAQFLT
ncbi:ATP-dependent nuclease [Candidatus Leptofilum sp.]|uniref:ATP-dependent nuclease n=1 Tax=Candidatus Leptofilum sp. TaxID=3241576 RepID=UPI003B5BD97E